MEFTNDQLIDTALNLAGYVAAVLFSLVIYSIYFGRKIANLEDAVRCAAGWNGAPGFNESVGIADAEDISQSAQRESRFTPDERFTTSTSAAPPEFVNLGAREKSMDNLAPERTDYRGKPDRFERNRGEVIRLARKMLEAGNSADRVSDLLPISESEMQLVQMGSRANAASRR